jgi:hypothetical protein
VKVYLFVFYLYVLLCNLDVLLCNDHNLENKNTLTKLYIWFYRKLFYLVLYFLY